MARSARTHAHTYIHVYINFELTRMVGSAGSRPSRLLDPHRRLSLIPSADDVLDSSSSVACLASPSPSRPSGLASTSSRRSACKSSMGSRRCGFGRRVRRHVLGGAAGTAISRSRRVAFGCRKRPRFRLAHVRRYSRDFVSCNAADTRAILLGPVSPCPLGVPFAGLFLSPSKILVDPGGE